jgi:superfamily II DNA/RNA helicase
MHAKPKHGKGRGGKDSSAFKRDKRMSSSLREETEAKALAVRIKEMAPAHGTTYSPPGGIKPMFADFPLSKYTQTGLSDQKYIHPTAIQLAAIPHALAGCVILDHDCLVLLAPAPVVCAPFVRVQPHFVIARKT